MHQTDTRQAAKNHLLLIRQMNSALVLREIRANQPITRAQIAQNLGLGKSTVSNIVEELVKRKLVLNLGERSANGSGGRPAPQFGFNPKSACGLGVDIGGTKIQVLLTDLVGEVIGTRRFATTNSVPRIVELVREVLTEFGVADRDVLALGVGVPGTVNDGVVVRAKALSWTNFDLRAALREHFDFPIFLNNDVNNAALGERWLGSAEFSDELFFVSLGTGIGGAIVTNGNIVYGASGRAGEIAYTVSRSDLDAGTLNVLGQHGVFERRVSGYALSRHGVEPEELFRRYSQGEPEAVGVIDDLVADLSVLISNVVSLLNPSMVVIGGGIAESLGVVLDRIRETVAGLTPVPTTIRLASLGSLAGAFGAVAFAIEQVEHGELETGATP